MNKEIKCRICNPDEHGDKVIVDNMWKYNSSTKERFPLLSGGLANYCPFCGRSLTNDGKGN